MLTPRTVLPVIFVLVAAATNGHTQSTRPQRIISVSPVITEILYGIGAFDHVVAVSDYCLYPPAVKNLPRVGGWVNTNLEKIVTLRPDLVLITEPQVPFVADNLKKLKLRFAIVPSKSLTDVFNSIDQIGRVTEFQPQAARLVQQTRMAVEEIRTQTKGLAKRRILAVVDRTPGTLRELTVATPGSFLAELVELAGGQMVTAPTEMGYVTINKEALASLDPDIILDIVHTPEGRLGEDQPAVWAAMSTLRAVREGKVRLVRDDFILHTSQFVIQTVKLLAATIHPEVFTTVKK